MNGVVNYDHIREALTIALQDELPPEKRDAILRSLDDAVANNADDLLCYGEGGYAPIFREWHPQP